MRTTDRGDVRQRGFSLLEMLLVLFVIVVLTSLVTLNVGSGDGRELQRQVRALRNVAEYAIEEAQYSGHDFGLLLQRDVDERGLPVLWLRWRERLPQGWRPVQRSEAVFADLQAPPGVDLELFLDGTRVLPLGSREAEQRAGSEPQWLFFASGETQTGELIWRDRDEGDVLWQLRWDALGRFSLYAKEEPDALTAAPL